MKKIFLVMLLLTTAFAGVLSVEQTGDLFLNEDNNYIIHVTDSIRNTPVFYATVELYKNDTLLGESKTNHLGYTTFILHPENLSTVAFRVTAEGYNEFILFDEVTERPLAEPVANLTAKVAQFPEDEPTSITGFILVNPSESGIFLFIMALAFVCLFGSSFLFYQHYIQSEMAKDENEEGVWETTKVFDKLTNWLKKE